MNQPATKSRPRKRNTTGPPYRKIHHTCPLGETPEVRALLKTEGLWDFVTKELQEVYYYRVDQHYRRRDFCAIGWANENGGWEVRSPGYIGCVGRKGMTFISGDPENLFVFQDFTDYLCWRYHHKNQHPSLLILNHPEFLPAAKKRALSFPTVTMCFDIVN